MTEERLGGPPFHEGPWIPGPEELKQFREDLDVALSSDYRSIILDHAHKLDEKWTKKRFQSLFETAGVDITDRESYVMCYPVDPLCALISPNPDDTRAMFFVSPEIGERFNELQAWEKDDG